MNCLQLTGKAFPVADPPHLPFLRPLSGLCENSLAARTGPRRLCQETAMMTMASSQTLQANLSQSYDRRGQEPCERQEIHQHEW